MVTMVEGENYVKLLVSSTSNRPKSITVDDNVTFILRIVGETLRRQGTRPRQKTQDFKQTIGM